MNGVNKAALWIFHCFGRVDRYVTGPSTSLIKKGPSRLGDSFLKWFSPSCCPFHHLIRAKSCAASTSSRARNRDLMRSSAVGVSVLLDTRGSTTG